MPTNSATFENCRDNLQTLIEFYNDNEKNKNEASTRHHLIDILIYQCLNWSKIDAEIEKETVNGYYTDYIFLKNKLVLEAKKQDIYFELHEGNNNAKYKIGSLCNNKNNKGIRDAIIQVQNYCSQTGIEYAAVCNGWQLIIFVGLKIGEPPLEGEIFVFNSLQNMYDTPIFDKNYEQKINNLLQNTEKCNEIFEEYLNKIWKKYKDKNFQSILDVFNWENIGS